ncbi:MFS family permease [Bradyrhizobium japonicum]
MADLRNGHAGGHDRDLPQQHLDRWDVSPGQMIAAGLSLSTLLATCLLVMAIAGCQSIVIMMLAMIGVALSFGLISPNAMNVVLRPMPDIRGPIIAIMAFIHMICAAAGATALAYVEDAAAGTSQQQRLEAPTGQAT